MKDFSMAELIALKLEDLTPEVCFSDTDRVAFAEFVRDYPDKEKLLVFEFCRGAFICGLRTANKAAQKFDATL